MLALSGSTRIKRKGTARTRTKAKSIKLRIQLDPSPQTSSVMPKTGLPAWTGLFRFLDLPAEMRLAVYQCLLPHNLLVSFDIIDELPQLSGRVAGSETEIIADGYARTRWKVTAWEGGSADSGGKKKAFHVKDGTALFLVNRFVSNEARAVLYGSNTFQLHIDGLPHHPISLSSPLIFGPLGLPHRLGLLRNLRSIVLDVYIDHADHWNVKRHRARLQHFVNIIKQHADDSAQSSLLKTLRVQLRSVNCVIRSSGKFMFALEELAALRGIEEVAVTGVEDWFARCLECCIKGHGGDVQEADWPLVEVKRKQNRLGRAKKVWVSTRKWYDPTLDWEEFARRNGIDLPRDIEKVACYDRVSGGSSDCIWIG